MNDLRSNYRPEIDGLRAFAVLSVVIFHAFPHRLQGGFIGVDIFFFISGFLITSHIFESLNKGTWSFLDFFSRRVRRIFPALILVMTTCMAFGAITLLADDYAQLGKHIASGATFVTNFILVNESGYFDSASETKPMLHLWSLAIEEQFYIAWPLILWLAWKARLNLFTITLLITAISFYLNIILVELSPAEAFFLPISRFWEMLSGSILAWLIVYKKDALLTAQQWCDTVLVKISRSQDVSPDGRLVINIMSFIGISLLISGVFLINESLPFPSQWTLVPIVGTALIILSGSSSWINKLVLMNPIVIWFGLISYPLYLWHWPILSFIEIIKDGDSHRDARLLAIVASIILAWLTYKLIEKPIRREGVLGKKAIALSLTLAAVGFSGFKVFETQGLVSRYSFLADSPVDVERLEKISRAWRFSDYPTPSRAYSDPKTGLLSVGKNLKSKTLLVGDSHTQQYWNSFDFLSDSNVYNSVSFQGASFPPKIEDFPNDPAIKVVALSYYWGYRYGSKYVKQELRCCGNGKNRTQGEVSIPYKKKTEMDSIDEKIANYISKVQSMGKEVIIILDNPFGEELNAQSMLYRDGFKISVKPNMILTRKEAESRSRDTRTRLLALAQGLNADVIDPIAHLCSSGTCNAFSKEHDLLYKDYDHISLYASRNSVDYIKRIVE
ncbi:MULTISPECIES: acyltransferase family protein [unclassified Vibrio]|uniref:acyltransferase family protein n=1 Tax=unclassified Vibrio TaxID=2614977 RepID=UPI00352DB7F4